MYKLNKTLLFIVKIPTAIISLFTSFISGILTMLTFGILGLTLHYIKHFLFILPVIFLSKLHQENGIIGKIISVLGLPFSVLGFIYSMLIGHGGEQSLRAYDISIFETFPYSRDFDDYAKSRKNWDELPKESRESIIYITQDPAFGNLIEDYKELYLLESGR